MTQPTVKVLQINQAELTDFVNSLIGSPVSAGATALTQLNDVTITGPGNGEHLVYNGAQWVNTLDLGFVVGDGIDSALFIGSPRTIATDSTVARRNATNTFQQTNTYTAAVGGISTGALFQSAAPGFILDDTGAAADESIWRVYGSGGDLFFDTRNDANSVSVNWLTVTRTGTTVDEIALTGTSLTFNGIEVAVGSPMGSGGGGVTSSTGADNRIAVFTSGTNIEGDASLTWDATTATMTLFDTGGADSAAFSHDGTNFTLEFTSTTDFRLRKPSDGGPGTGAGTIHISANFGSPATLTQASTTDPVIRVGMGSPYTTVKPSQIAVIDKFDATIVARNTFADTELSLSAENPGVELLGRSSSFFDIIFHDQTTSFVAMEINPSNIDFIDLPLARVKFDVTRDTLATTENNYNASVFNVTFATPAGGGSTITGKLGGGDGQVWTIHNVAGPGSPANTDNITIAHASGSSVANARFLLPGAASLVIPSLHSATFIYDDGTVPAGERWRLMSTSGF